MHAVGRGTMPAAMSLLEGTAPAGDGPRRSSMSTARPSRRRCSRPSLFGWERGAFTDARQAKPGLFQAAQGGTIFLDEIGLMPMALQAKLLKVIEEQTVRRLGSTRGEALDV
jgi:two-component system response regulator AtoC